MVYYNHIGVDIMKKLALLVVSIIAILFSLYGCRTNLERITRDENILSIENELGEEVSTAKAGDILTINFKAYEDKIISKFIFNDQDQLKQIENYKYKFKFNGRSPKYSLEYSDIYLKLEKNTNIGELNIDDFLQVNQLDLNKIKYNTLIKLTLKQKEGYKIESLVINNEVINISENQYEFRLLMDSKITVNIQKLEDITLNYDGVSFFDDKGLQISQIKYGATLSKIRISKPSYEIKKVVLDNDIYFKKVSKIVKNQDFTINKKIYAPIKLEITYAPLYNLVLTEEFKKNFIYDIKKYPNLEALEENTVIKFSLKKEYYLGYIYKVLINNEPNLVDKDIELVLNKAQTTTLDCEKEYREYDTSAVDNSKYSIKYYKNSELVSKVKHNDIIDKIEVIAKKYYIISKIAINNQMILTSRKKEFVITNYKISSEVSLNVEPEDYYVVAKIKVNNNLIDITDNRLVEHNLDHGETLERLPVNKLLKLKFKPHEMHKVKDIKINNAEYLFKANNYEVAINYQVNNNIEINIQTQKFSIVIKNIPKGLKFIGVNGIKKDYNDYTPKLNDRIVLQRVEEDPAQYRFITRLLVNNVSYAEIGSDVDLIKGYHPNGDEIKEKFVNCLTYQILDEEVNFNEYQLDQFVNLELEPDENFSYSKDSNFKIYKKTIFELLPNGTTVPKQVEKVLVKKNTIVLFSINSLGKQLDKLTTKINSADEEDQTGLIKDNKFSLKIIDNDNKNEHEFRIKGYFIGEDEAKITYTSNASKYDKIVEYITNSNLNSAENKKNSKFFTSKGENKTIILKKDYNIKIKINNQNCLKYDQVKGEYDYNILALVYIDGENKTAQFMSGGEIVLNKSTKIEIYFEKYQDYKTTYSQFKNKTSKASILNSNEYQKFISIFNDYVGDLNSSKKYLLAVSDYNKLNKLVNDYINLLNSINEENLSCDHKDKVQHDLELSEEIKRINAKYLAKKIKDEIINYTNCNSGGLDV